MTRSQDGIIKLSAWNWIVIIGIVFSFTITSVVSTLGVAFAWRSTIDDKLAKVDNRLTSIEIKQAYTAEAVGDLSKEFKEFLKREQRERRVVGGP